MVDLFEEIARMRREGSRVVPDIWGSWPGPQGSSGSTVGDGGNKHNWVQFFIPNYGWIPADPTAGEAWFARLSDNYHVPVMSVNYVYQRAWGSGNWQSVFSGEEPVITRGFQMPEFIGTTTMVSSLTIIISLIAITKTEHYGKRTSQHLRRTRS